MPLCKRNIWIVVEARVIGLTFYPYPWRLGVKQAVHILRRRWKRGVDGTGMRVDQIRPCWIPKPQRTSAVPAEVAASRAQMGTGSFIVGEMGAIDSKLPLALHLHALGYRAQVDGIAARTCCFSADRAVATHEGNRLCRFNRELDLGAVAGTMKQHSFLPVGGCEPNAQRTRQGAPAPAWGEHGTIFNNVSPHPRNVDCPLPRSIHPH